MLAFFLDCIPPVGLIAAIAVLGLAVRELCMSSTERLVRGWKKERASWRR